ncbi:pyrroloquinoline quinone biosynthesis protein PqqB [Streptomyces sp. UNOC14_S4]|uniref:pyrroloquinoline quinone biosynthesis protein PqqB n=1 Tax=Streptomyces sp. UNOC14_S4 TaxID=2872340 RepID=UPI001E3AE1FC|nr:pyrroloquinoline quinone biosynthesis protein PqqB [Streptomyces sp. UNOC14_S4]MCC3767346.1 pyrroloquinoline quinone biosynthesis protein PqqB [Streptomyces sp. UNOC14_S4]
MRLRILGTAAGGGLPQWNCACPGCSRARAAGPAVWRTQECLAVSASPDAWYLVNASPDIRPQILASPELAPPGGTRRTPLRGVLLTDGELDHTTGLLALREGAALDLFAPAAVVAALTEDFPLRSLLAPYGAARWQTLAGELRLDDGRLRVSVIPVSDKRPRYAAGSSRPGPWVVAYRFDDTVTGSAAVYAPSLARWPEELAAALSGARCAILDGTFWSEDEMERMTGHGPGARAMGHLPITGAGGTLARLRGHTDTRWFYTHLNNTNPAADPASRERSLLTSALVEVAADGREIHL